MRSTTRVAAFDLDGTIIDSRAAMRSSFAAAVNRVFGGHEKSDRPDFRELEVRQGRPFSNICAELGWPSLFAQIFSEESLARTDMVMIFPGMSDLLRSITNNNVRLAIVTGKDRERAVALLDGFGIADLFDVLVCGDDDIAGKPSAAGLFRVMENLDSDRRSMVFIGDSPVDLQSAENAELQFIGVRWPGHPELLAARPNVLVVQSAQELLDALLASFVEGAK